MTTKKMASIMNKIDDLIRRTKVDVVWLSRKDFDEVSGYVSKVYGSYPINGIVQYRGKILKKVKTDG